jgi:hypothetical protein
MKKIFVREHRAQTTPAKPPKEVELAPRYFLITANKSAAAVKKIFEGSYQSQCKGYYEIKDAQV